MTLYTEDFNDIQRTQRYTASSSVVTSKYLHQSASLARDLLVTHSAIESRVEFPVFAEAATERDRKSADRRFKKFLEDT